MGATRKRKSNSSFFRRNKVSVLSECMRYRKVMKRHKAFGMELRLVDEVHWCYFVRQGTDENTRTVLVNRQQPEELQTPLLVPNYVSNRIKTSKVRMFMYYKLSKRPIISIQYNYFSSPGSLTTT